MSVRFRFKRQVKRKVDNGIISEEEAQPKFLRGSSSLEAPLDVQQQTSEPVAPWQSVGSSRIVAADAGNAHALEKKIPHAEHPFTAEDVQLMFDNGYFRYPETPFWNGKDIWQVKRGTHCLWKNVPVGKHGGESTKTELFHGECHGEMKLLLRCH